MVFAVHTVLPVKRWMLILAAPDMAERVGVLATDLEADPLDILRWFVRRWSIEVTFTEVRRHLGVETSGNGPNRQSPAPHQSCRDLFSLITLWANDAYTTQAPTVRVASGHPSSANLPQTIIETAGDLHVFFTNASAAIQATSCHRGCPNRPQHSSLVRRSSPLRHRCRYRPSELDVGLRPAQSFGTSNGLKYPTLCPRPWLIKAISPAQTGAARLVPPITSGLPPNNNTAPDVGEAVAATSGIPRPAVPSLRRGTLTLAARTVAQTRR